MKIKFCRCDDRLIHGQIVYKWLKSKKCKEIVIIDDELTRDTMTMSITKMAAPRDVELKILTINQGISYFYGRSSEEILVLVKSIFVVRELIKNGIEIEELNIGRVPTGTGKKYVYRNVYLSLEEFEILKNIKEKGTKINIKMVPDDDEVLLDSIIKNISGRWSK